MKEVGAIVDIGAPFEVGEAGDSRRPTKIAENNFFFIGKKA